jgi:hypothetical protein
MKKLMVMCFALSLLLTLGLAAAQDTPKAPDAAPTAQDTPKAPDTMKDTKKMDTSAKSTKVTGKISEDGKTFVGDSDSKSWTINNPEAVKGHEGHHVTLTAQVDADKSEVHVVSLKMAKEKMAK